jgi:hypothetical protein
VSDLQPALKRSLASQLLRGLTVCVADLFSNAGIGPKVWLDGPSSISRLTPEPSFGHVIPMLATPNLTGALIQVHPSVA